MNPGNGLLYLYGLHKKKKIVLRAGDLASPTRDRMSSNFNITAIVKHFMLTSHLITIICTYPFRKVLFYHAQKTVIQNLNSQRLHLHTVTLFTSFFRHAICVQYVWPKFFPFIRFLRQMF